MTDLDEEWLSFTFHEIQTLQKIKKDKPSKIEMLNVVFIFLQN